MPVHYFTPPERTTDIRESLTSLVDELEAAGETVIATERYGAVTAIFTNAGTSAKPTKRPAKKKAAAK